MSTPRDGQFAQPDLASELLREAGEGAAAPGLTHNESDRLSPGEILRESRLTHAYSVADLCVQTKLAPHTVEALENNDFEALPEPIFVRGYYRRCAVILDLDAKRLLTAYIAWGGKAPVAQLDQSVALAGVIPQDRAPGHSRLRGVLLFLVFAVVVVPAEDSTDTLADASSGTAETIPPERPARESQMANSAAISAFDAMATAEAPAPADNAAELLQTGTDHDSGGRNLTQPLGIIPAAAAKRSMSPPRVGAAPWPI
jgi:cytoskeleton protein RodZ